MFLCVISFEKAYAVFDSFFYYNIYLLQVDREERPDVDKVK